MTLPSTLQFGQVQDWGGVLGPSLDDDNLPDVEAVKGTVTFTPSVPVQLVSDLPRSRWLTIRPFQFGYDGDGVLRDAQDNDGVTLIATDSAGLSRQDWTWVATFGFADGVTRPPVIFKLPTGTVVDLTDQTPVQESTGVAVTRGLPGESAYQLAKRLDPSIGTEAEWLESLNGDVGTAAVTSVNTKTGSVVLTFSDVGAQPAGSYATTQALSDGLATKVNSSTYTAGIAGAKDRAQHTGTQLASTISDLPEAVQDLVGAMVSGASGVTTAYTDNGDGTGTLVITGAGGTGSFDAESTRDAIGTALVGVGLVAVAVNDAADTITITTTATANATDAALRDRSTHTGTQLATTIGDSTVVGRALIRAADAAAARDAIGAGTSSLAIGTTAATAKAGDYQPTAANISDATTVGRSVLTAADAAAARTAIAAGTSSLTIGTTSTTAKAGDYAPPSDAAAGTASMRSLGTTSTTAAAGNDSRIVGAAQRVLTKRTITAAYTLALADATDMVMHSTSATAITITLPTDTAVAIAQEVAIPWRQYGAGQLTFAAASGATLISRGSVFKSAGQNAEGTITKVAADTWLLSGDIVA